MSVIEELWLTLLAWLLLAGPVVLLCLGLWQSLPRGQRPLLPPWQPLQADLEWLGCHRPHDADVAIPGVVFAVLRNGESPGDKDWVTVAAHTTAALAAPLGAGPLNAALMLIPEESHEDYLRALQLALATVLSLPLQMTFVLALLWLGRLVTPADVGVHGRRRGRLWWQVVWPGWSARP